MNKPEIECPKYITKEVNLLKLYKYVKYKHISKNKGV